MPRNLTSDDYHYDLNETFGLQSIADEILRELKTQEESPVWEWIRKANYEDVIRYARGVGIDIPEELEDLYINDGEYEGLFDLFDENNNDEFIPTAPAANNRKFDTGAEFRGSKQIVETENEKIYIPSSYYCALKVYNKFLELQTRGKNIIPLEGKTVNPYFMSKVKFLNHILKYTIKCNCKNVCGEKRCTPECIKEKRAKYEDKKTGADYYKEFSAHKPAVDIPENHCKPSICKVWYDEEKKKVMVKTLNKAAHTHPTMCIGLVHLTGTELHHAVLLKDYHNVTVEDITIRLTNTKELYPGVRRFMGYRYREPKEIVVSWDIETWVNIEKNKKGKYEYKFCTASIGYNVLNIKQKTILKECEIVTNFSKDETNGTDVFNEFLTQLYNYCIQNKIKEINMYAHNSGKFDTIFAKKSSILKFEKEISAGNNVKNLKASADLGQGKVIFSFLDTLPFTLQSLKEACKTFKTKIKKETFDIINKSRKWYMMNRSEEWYNKVMNTPELLDEYLYEHMDRYMKVKHNVEVVRHGLFQYSCDPKFKESAIKEKENEMNKLKKGWADWRTYLKYDVESLANLLMNVEEMYNSFGFSITNYVGLPGVAMDMMNSYCFNMKKLWVPNDPSLVELFHASTYGGKNIHFKRNWDSPLKPGVRWDSEQKAYVYDPENRMESGLTPIEDGIYADYLICLDMNSLYPSQLFACGYPTGKPFLVEKDVLESQTWNKYPHYVGEFEIEIPNIRYAIHPYRSEKGALLYPSNQTIIGVYNDADIRDMMKDGYKVKMRKGVYFKRSEKIFSNLVEMLYEMRKVYKSLNPDDPEYSKEYITKICLNAMFGKYAESIRNIVKFFSGSEDELKKKLNKKTRYKKMENNQYRLSETYDVPKVSKPTYIAGYVTAYSRGLVNEIIRKVGVENVYYSDTDSIYMQYSVFNKAKLKCGSELCGYKNDYGDGVMITKARFLDLKKCYFEFRTLVKSKYLDKWKKVGAACKNPIDGAVNGEEIVMEEVDGKLVPKMKENEDGEMEPVTKDIPSKPYYEKTFKFKYTGINFREIVASSAYEPDFYGDDRQKYAQKMIQTSRLVDKFIENNKNNRKKELEREYDNVKFIMQRFNKNGVDVTINLGEFAFHVNPEKRGNWKENPKTGELEYYALGFIPDEEGIEENKKKERFLYKPLKEEDEFTLNKKFDHLPRTSFGYKCNKNEQYLRSRRPLFYNIRMHIEVIKDEAEKKRVIIKHQNSHIQEYNSACRNGEDLHSLINNKFEDYLKSGDDALSDFLYFLQERYIRNDTYDRKRVEKVEKLKNNDVIFYDGDKKLFSDIYIHFFKHEYSKEPVKFADYNKKYRILTCLEEYRKLSKEEKQKLNSEEMMERVDDGLNEEQAKRSNIKYRYFVTNTINVREEVIFSEKPDDVLEEQINPTLFPVVILSTRFNKDLGLNNLSNKETMTLMNKFI